MNSTLQMEGIRMVPESSKCPDAYIMVGIPGSGKTTWAVEKSREGPVHVALDVFRAEVYGRIPLHLDNQLEKKVCQ